MSKILKSKSTGSGSANIYIPKLMWFEFADHFLKRNNDGVRELETNTVSFLKNYFITILLIKDIYIN